jgi:multiple sugar transport system permease protein
LKKTFKLNEARFLIGPAVVYLLIFSIFPLLYSLGISFFEYDRIDSRWNFVGFKNYSGIFTDPVFWKASFNTLLMCGTALVLEVIAGVGLAIFFGQKLKGAKLVRALLIVPMILNPVVVGLMFRALLNPEWGFLNYILFNLGYENPPIWLADPKWTIWVLILVDAWQWTPFIFVVVFARYQALPHEVFESARVDGASPSKIVRFITLPMLSSAIAFAAVFRGVDSFRNFDLVYGLTFGGPGRETTTLSFYAFENGFVYFRYGYGAAVSYVMVILATLGFFLLLRVLPLRKSE